MEPFRDMRNSFMIRVALSIIILAAFFVGSLIYVGFYAPNYNWIQDIIVLLVALVLAVAALSILWLSWVGRRGMRGWWRN
jgi:hypothetical protein